MEENFSNEAQNVPGEGDAREGGESVLSEEELEALQTEHPESSDSKDGCHAYDFRDPARILNGRLPGVDALNESFTQAMEETLRRFLRRAVVVQVGETLLSRQGDYINTLATPASVQRVGLPVQDSTFLITQEGSFVYACVGAYFGGSGSETPEDSEREFSGSERRVIKLLTQHILSEFKTAWASVCALEFTNPQALNFSTLSGDHDDQILVVTKFKVELEPGAGEFHIALPYSFLDLLRPLLSSSPRPSESSQQWQYQLQQQAWNISVETYSLFKPVEITVGELMALQPGDFIPIPDQDRVSVMVDELALYEAEPGTSNELVAAKILSRIQVSQ
jgi:flagellar motor switch protein FliM